MRKQAAALALALAVTVAARAAGAEDATAAKAAMQAGNYAEAYCIWRALAEDEHAEAQFNLGWLYHNGYGLVIDDVEAARWWELAAQQGHRDALAALGNLYQFGGRDVPRDGVRALDYFLRAARAGDEDAALVVRTLIARNDPSVRERSVELITQHTQALGAPLEVAVDRANVRKGPGTEHASVTVLGMGAPLVELSRRGQWVQVGIVASGQTGWLRSRLVRVPMAPPGGWPSAQNRR